MSRRPSDPTVVLRDLLVTILRNEGGFPISTRELADRAGRLPWDLNRHLTALEKARKIGCIRRGTTNSRCNYWYSNGG